jgi:hypothetical protein
LFIKPLRDIDRRTAAAREKLSQIQDQRRAYFAAEDRLKAIAGKTFGETVEQASAVSGELLTRQIIDSGLAESAFMRLPSGPRRLRGANEIGWQVQGEGPLNKVINLLFLLNSSPWLHRTENLTLSPGDSPGRVRVRFNYLTLVIYPAMGVTRTNLSAPYAVDSPQRRLFDIIAARDLMRPYIRLAPSEVHSSYAAGSPTGPRNYRIVSLSEWAGQPEIHVRDLAARKTMLFRPGDQLAGGTVLMVDYRPMPEPDNPMLQSFSRVILKIDQDYWAIEEGKTFADKHKLSQEQLPPPLASAAKP